MSERFKMHRDFAILIVALAMTALYDMLKNLYNQALPVKIPNRDILFALVGTIGIILLALRFLPKHKTMEQSKRETSPTKNEQP
jgi:lipid-A-disaccharide synthase-like uncharacterized protein